MGKVTYIEFKGVAHEVDVRPGQSLMEGAVGNLVPGVLADCGGACACATCHVYVDAPWREHMEPPSETESAMLEVVCGREDSSRLSCQIKMKEEFDGLVLRLPATQV